MSQKQTVMILRMLEKSYSGLTFGEICTKINDSKDAIRKTLHYLHKDGRVARATDANGIVHYNITEKGKERVAQVVEITSVIKPSPPVTLEESEKRMDVALYLDEAVGEETAQKVMDGLWKKSTKSNRDGWHHIVEEAEQRAFAKGYSLGVQEAQRSAYAEGRQSVLQKLAVLLS